MSEWKGEVIKLGAILVILVIWGLCTIGVCLLAMWVLSW